MSTSAFGNEDMSGFNDAFGSFADQTGKILNAAKFDKEASATAKFNQILGAATNAVGDPLITKGVFGLTDRLKTIKKKAVAKVKQVADDVLGDGAGGEASAEGDLAATGRDLLTRARTNITSRLAGGNTDLASTGRDILARARADVSSRASGLVQGAEQDVAGRVRGLAQRPDPFGTPTGEQALRPSQPLNSAFDNFDEAGFDIPKPVAPVRGLLDRIMGRSTAAPEAPPQPLDFGDEPTIADPGASTGRIAALRNYFSDFTMGDGGMGTGSVRGGGLPSLTRTSGIASSSAADDEPISSAINNGLNKVVSGASKAAKVVTGTEDALTTTDAITDAAAASEGGLNPIADAAALALGLVTVFGGMAGDKAPPVPKPVPVANPSSVRGLGGF
jgi:hypothetical protein